MAISFVFHRVISILYAFSLIALITACGGGGSTTNAPANSSGIGSSAKAVNDGVGAAAKFYNPAYIVLVGPNLYITEQLNQTVRKIVIATGEVTTVAGKAGVKGSTNGVGAAARFDTPNGITSDGINLYVADSANHTIRKIVIATGMVTTLAGTPGISNGNDGIGAEASFLFPNGITTDGTNLYVTSDQTIRKIVVATGVVTTLAGANFMLGDSDGIGAAARFANPIDITADGSNLFVVDSFSSNIRKISIATGAVTTFTVVTNIDGVEMAAGFNHPRGITSDGTNLYVSDTNSKIIRKITIATATVTKLAGTANVSGSVDAVGAAASFDMPVGITTDGINLYVADIFNNIIRKIVISTGEVTTLAGTAGVRAVTDDMGR